MVCVGLEYGLHPTDFFPKETGRLQELPKLLAPLTSLKDDFTVFSGLDHPGVKGGHFATVFGSSRTSLERLRPTHPPVYRIWTKRPPGIKP